MLPAHPASANAHAIATAFHPTFIAASSYSKRDLYILLPWNERAIPECLVPSFRGGNDTVNRGIIVARQIIHFAAIHVVGSITHNNGSRGIGQNIVTRAHSNIAPGPFHRHVAAGAFNCSAPSKSLRISRKTGENHDCRHKKDRHRENTPC